MVCGSQCINGHLLSHPEAMVACDPQRLGFSTVNCSVPGCRLGTCRVDRAAAAAAHGALKVHLDAVDAAEQRVGVRKLPLRPEHCLQM